MKAIGFYQGLAVEDDNSFVDFEKPIPQVAGHDVLVKVTGLSINPVDIKIREGVTERLDQPKVIGYDAVGIIEAIGDQVQKFQTGDRIYYAGSTKRDGSHQEYQLVDERIAAIAPKTLSDAEAAALPLTALVSYELLFEKFNVIPAANANQDKSILVINGAGGVGSIFNQLAKWAGLTVLATGSKADFDWLKRIGVDFPIDYRQDLSTSLATIGQQKVDYIAVLFDITYYFDQLIDLIKPLGHIGTIVGINKHIDMEKLKNLSVSFDWDYMFTKTDHNIELASQGEALKIVANLIDSGKLQSTVAEVIDDGINARNIKRATQLVETGKAKGKVVVTGKFNGLPDAK